MHQHNTCCCEHELKYCAHCDVVYCKRCGKEWHFYGPYGSAIVTWPSGGTAGDVVQYTWTAHNCGTTQG